MRVLTLVDRDTGWPCSIQVPKKGAECGNFVLDTVEQYLNTLGHSRVTLQIDSEGSLRSVATAIRTRMGPQKVKVRESPPYSHQSQGAVEGEHSLLAGLVRTWLMDLQNRYPNCGVDVNHTVFPWLVKYAAWSVARFQVKTTDKMTPYKIVNGVESLSSICRFGETVMAKLPKPGTKAQRRWIRGLWVGKLDRDNTNIILTECGALSVRSVRRLPAEAQANRTLMGSAAGVPWALRQGRVLREPPPMVAQPVVLPAPAVEAAAAEEPDEYRELEGPAQLPTMAHEGEAHRVDQEAQDVEAAAVLENLVPLEDIEVFPPGGGIGDPASELGAPAEENPSTAPEGAGSAASSAAAPPRPPFPTGLGEGGLGQGGAKREGARDSEEARPPKQPKGTAKKAQRIERLKESSA